MSLVLKPSELFFSQKGISGRFGKSTCHRYTRIGHTLNGLIRGEIQISDIPIISVVKKDDKWFTLDNRRLWVFRKLEEAGKCETIRVKEEQYNAYRDGEKFSTENGGVSVSMNEKHRRAKNPEHEVNTTSIHVMDTKVWMRDCNWSDYDNTTDWNGYNDCSDLDDSGDNDDFEAYDDFEDCDDNDDTTYCDDFD